MSERKPFLPASLNYDDYFKLLAVKKPTELKNNIKSKRKSKNHQSKKRKRRGGVKKRSGNKKKGKGLVKRGRKKKPKKRSKPKAIFNIS